ncbi:MAG: iron-containing alcohol dehydrogenase [Cyclobacteriaceae bacterium]
MMVYNIEPEVHFGSIEELPGIISGKFVNILLLTSPTIYKYIRKTSFFDLSNELGLKVECYSDIKPNAPLDMLDWIKNTYKKPDLLLAIGGGSTIDSAKALSVTWGKDNIYDHFYKKTKKVESKIFNIAVPTTAGTGAELSYGAILEDTSNNQKGGLRGKVLQPNKVFIDIDLYRLAPVRLKAETGFDCLTHAIETYLSIKASPLVKYQSVAAIQEIFRSLPDAVQHSDSSGLLNMAMASCMMGVNLAKSSTCLPHRIQYVIGPLTDTSHAQGLVMLYKGWIPVISQTESFKELEIELGWRRGELSARILELKKSLGLTYTLSDFGITISQVDQIAAKVSGSVENDPCFTGVSTIETIIRNSI